MGGIPADLLPLEVVDSLEEVKVPPRISGLVGYSRPGSIGAATYVGRLALAFLREEARVAPRISGLVGYS